MAKTETLTRESFELLLRWLDVDTQAAAERYERIRTRLIRLFVGRGCREAEHLADLTFDRVAVKIPQMDGNYVGDPAPYFLAVAKNIHHEWLRVEQKRVETKTADPVAAADHDDEPDREYYCLEDCLTKLAAASREMILEYYRHEKPNRIERRHSQAASLGISPENLHVRANRVRAKLLECVRQCVAQN